MSDDEHGAAIAKLQRVSLSALRDHYGERPTNKDTVFEALSAFGSVIGVIIGGCGASAKSELRDFVNLVVDEQTELILNAERAKELN